MADANEATYFLTYVGTGVAELKDAGVFASGTSAYVTEAVARAALASGGPWSVKDPSGKQIGSLPTPQPAKAAPPPPPAPARAEPAKAEEKKAEKHDDHHHKEHKAEKGEEKKEEVKPAEAGKA